MPTGPIPRSARLLAAGLAVLTLLAGCSHGGNAPATADTGGSTSTTAAAGPRPAVFPLTGLPVGSATAAASRPALSIKVENTPPARPQAGLDAADVVTEELVEGGITRFFVTFQSHDSHRGPPPALFRFATRAPVGGPAAPSAP